MSAEPMLRELFRGLETTIHERLNLIEQVVRATEKPKVPLYDHEFIQRIEQLEETVAASSDDHLRDSFLENRVTALENALKHIMEKMENLASASATAPEPEVLETNVVQDEEEEEEVEEQEEEEEEEAGLEELEYNGITYGKDSENQVYLPDEDGNVDGDSPVGKWNGRKIIFYKH